MKIFKDTNSVHLYDALINTSLEHQRQLAKWGLQNRSLFEWLTYLTEEVGELAEAISEYEYRGGALVDISKEAIQVAALATRISAIVNQNLVEKEIV